MSKSNKLLKPAMAINGYMSSHLIVKLSLAILSTVVLPVLISIFFSCKMLKSGWTCLCILIMFAVVSLIVELSEQYCLKYNDENFGVLQSTMIQSTGKVCISKYKTLGKKIVAIKNGDDKPVPIISEPCNQFSNIIDNMQKCLPDLLSYGKHKIKADDLYITLAYKFDNEIDNNWHWANNSLPERGLTLDESIIISINETYSVC